MFRLAIVSVLVLLALGSCGRDSLSPTAPPPGGLHASDRQSAPKADSVGWGSFFPLQVGNEWHYAGHLVEFISTDHGDSVIEERHWSEVLIATGQWSSAGRTYTRLVRQADEFPSSWIVRQDATGLYDFRGASLPEGIRLSYPLHSGRTWSYGQTDWISSRVEGLEVVATPMGRVPTWRISQQLSPLFPADGETFWYARCGLVATKRTVHLEFPGPQPPIVLKGGAVLETRLQSMKSAGTAVAQPSQGSGADEVSGRPPGSVTLRLRALSDRR
jgi:hypothetical protein